MPAHAGPWAFGSTNGSAWNAVFVYDGWDRITGARARRPRADDRRARGTRTCPRAPGAAAAASARRALRRALGLELRPPGALAALALAGARVGAAWTAAGRAGLGRAAVWLALGTVLFSAQRDLRPRYLEALTPRSPRAPASGGAAARAPCAGGRCAAARWPWPARSRSSPPS